jgi:hypothetical protein
MLKEVVVVSLEAASLHLTSMAEDTEKGNKTVDVKVKM